MTQKKKSVLKQIPEYPKSQVVLYKNKLEVKLEKDTVWLPQAEIAKLFQTERSVIGKHIRNIFNAKELRVKSNVQKMHIASSDKPVMFYNLDVIISVGYRVNSLCATQFRIWATGILKKHLTDGYTINKKRLQEQTEKFQSLQRAIKLISSTKDRIQLEYKEAMGLLEIINDYNYALGLLDDYDYKRLKITRTTKKEKFILRYEDASNIVQDLKGTIGSSELFGKERDGSFQSSIVTIYQTFDGKELYPSVEEKAANLLYFIVKNHSFVDGNKRIAASLFLWFLEGNGLLYNENGTKRMADNALVALTLMIAESNPSEREVIVPLVVNLINRNN